MKLTILKKGPISLKGTFKHKPLFRGYIETQQLGKVNFAFKTPEIRKLFDSMPEMGEVDLEVKRKIINNKYY